MLRAGGELLPRSYGSGERAPSPLASSLSLEGEGWGEGGRTFALLAQLISRASAALLVLSLAWGPGTAQCRVCVMVW
jgi:hypothetical protein